MSIKKAILEKNEGNEVEKSEYVNLILDDMAIGGDISLEDKTFLEGFTETQFLSLNSTGLKSLANLPKMEKLERLELSDNKIGSTPDTFSQIWELYPNLRVFKLSNNQIKTLEDLKPLSKCTKLDSIDLSNNPVSTLPTGDEETTKKANDEYVAKVRELLPTIEIIDGFNREGQEVVSEDEEDDDDDEDDDGDEDDDDEDDDEEAGEDEDDDEDDEEDDDELEEIEGEGGPQEEKKVAEDDDSEDDGDDKEETAEKSVGKKRQAQGDLADAGETKRKKVGDGVQG